MLVPMLMLMLVLMGMLFVAMPVLVGMLVGVLVLVLVLAGFAAPVGVLVPLKFLFLFFAVLMLVPFLIVHFDHD